MQKDAKEILKSYLNLKTDASIILIQAKGNINDRVNISSIKLWNA